jgi:hypothetical protein
LQKAEALTERCVEDFNVICPHESLGGTAWYQFNPSQSRILLLSIGTNNKSFTANSLPIWIWPQEYLPLTTVGGPAIDLPISPLIAGCAVMDCDVKPEKKDDDAHRSPEVLFPSDGSRVGPKANDIGQKAYGK